MQIRLSLGASGLVLAAFLVALPIRDAASQAPADPKAATDAKADKIKKKAQRKANSDAKKKLGSAMKSGDVNEKGVYEMAGAELEMDCKRLTGSMKITISRLKDAHSRPGGSALAETTHKTVAPLFGHSTASASRQASLARERAKLAAYNRQLAAKNCKTLDIEAELARPADPPKKY